MRPRYCLLLILTLLPGSDLRADHARVPWTTSRVRGSPDPPPPYRTERAFPKLSFQAPTELVPVPGFDRFAVAELGGRIFTFRNDPAADSADLLIDLQRIVYGLAFHPRFVENGYLFVVSGFERAHFLQVSRFVVRRDGPWRCVPASETAIFRWPFRGTAVHNGGSLRFGPDGYLYVGTGDGSPDQDGDHTGQDVSDLLGAIHRIDVDRAPRLRGYRVPPDNPFVGVPGARPEIWAFGVRQPWKLSFDRPTGDLWVGEVGQDRWESVLRVQRGGNYGWSVTEGGHPFRPDRQPGPTPILPPVVSHPHSEFRALIGGLVYRGQRLAELAGTYVYGDYETGKIWGIRLNGDQVSWHGDLAATHLRVVGFAEDAAHELYVLDHDGGTVHRLTPNVSGGPNRAFPRLLSETGVFASVSEHRPAPGIVPYTVNAALWSDGAAKERFLALPGNAQIRFDSVPSRPLVPAPLGWWFPDGTVLVKTFALEMEPGNPASRRRVETRLLHLEQLADTGSVRDQFWRGYSYAWNEDQSDAVLVDAGGLDRPYTLRDAAAPGGVRRQTWHYPSRAECTLCHSVAAKFVLGVTTPQLNREIEVGGRKVNQLTALEHLGLFTEPLPAPPEQLPRLADYSDERADLESRARAYLHANCAHCHILFGGGNSAFQLQMNLSLAQTGIVGARPVHGGFNVADARLIAPGAPERSMIYHRIAAAGEGRMPPVASTVVDEDGARLIEAWVRQMPEETSPWRYVWAGVVVVVAAAVVYHARRRRGPV